MTAPTATNEYLTCWVVGHRHLVVANRGAGETEWTVREQIGSRFVEHATYPDRDDAEAGALALVALAALDGPAHHDCTWWCALCECCHANACPALWGGDPEAPCGHTVSGREAS